MLRSQLPTPALMVDMDAMEHNLHTMAAFFAGGPTRLRPHYKNHKCVALARRQIAAGAIGITCATLGEAEALANRGITGILLANEIADAVQIERFVALSRRTEIITAVDNAVAVEALANASARAGLHLNIVVDVNIGMGRCGAAPGEPVLALAQRAHARGLRVRGVMGYDGHSQRLLPGPEKTAAVEASAAQLVDSARLLAAHGIQPEIVTTGGTGTHAIAGRYPGITEIQGGTYLLMDTDYHTVTPQFKPALSVLATVISRSGNERLILNAGLKEVSGERGVPQLRDVPGAKLRRLNAEHAIVDIVDPALPLQVGDRAEIWAHYSDATMNLHRRLYGVRGDLVEETFELES